MTGGWEGSSHYCGGMYHPKLPTFLTLPHKTHFQYFFLSENVKRNPKIETLEMTAGFLLLLMQSNSITDNFSPLGPLLYSCPLSPSGPPHLYHLNAFVAILLQKHFLRLIHFNCQLVCTYFVHNNN